MSLQLAGAKLTESSAIQEIDIVTETTVNGTTYRYFKNGAADLVAGDFCVFYSSTKIATKASTSTATGVNNVGVLIPQYAIPASEYGWFAVKGFFSVKVLANCAADKPLYTSATSGSLDDTSSSMFQNDGGVALGTAQGGAGGLNTTAFSHNYMTVRSV